MRSAQRDLRIGLSDRSHRQSALLPLPGLLPSFAALASRQHSQFKFVTRSCVQTKETVKMDDGRELPLMKLETTSESNPFYTGTQKSVDNLGGRVEKFRNKFAHLKK